MERQPGLFQEPVRLFVCTPSRLAAYEDCPRRYRYTYVDRPTPPKGPPWAHNSLGASVHTALKSWFEPARDAAAARRAGRACSGPPGFARATGTRSRSGRRTAAPWGG